MKPSDHQMVALGTVADFRDPEHPVTIVRDYDVIRLPELVLEPEQLPALRSILDQFETDAARYRAELAEEEAENDEPADPAGPGPAHWVSFRETVPECRQPGYRQPGGHYACTAQPDHAGDHVAFKPDGNGEYARWAQLKICAAPSDAATECLRDEDHTLPHRDEWDYEWGADEPQDTAEYLTQMHERANPAPVGTAGA